MSFWDFLGFKAFLKENSEKYSGLSIKHRFINHGIRNV